MTKGRRMDSGGEAGETQRSGGERSEPERRGVSPADARPQPPPTEVLERPWRRTFSAAYKLQILAEADRLEGTGEIGAMLRREGLYDNYVGKWRAQRDAGALHALTAKKRGRPAAAPNPLTPDVARLTKENARLLKKLKKAEAIIEFQKKVAALLELDETDPPTSDGSAS